MEGFKAFEKGLICRGKQYAENTVFEENQATICRNGMHFCKNPLDVFDYYPLIDKNGDFSEFAKVESLDVAHTDDEKKYCTKKLKIGAKISVTDYIKGAFKITYENIKNEVAEATKDAKDSGYDATLAGGESATLAGGDYANLAGGNSATLSGGDYAIMIGDHGSRVKGGIGSVITLVERNEMSEIIAFKAEQVDGERIKADTWYRLVDGEFKEV